MSEVLDKCVWIKLKMKNLNTKFELRLLKFVQLAETFYCWLDPYSERERMSLWYDLVGIHNVTFFRYESWFSLRRGEWDGSSVNLTLNVCVHMIFSIIFRFPAVWHCWFNDGKDVRLIKNLCYLPQWVFFVTKGGRKVRGNWLIQFHWENGCLNVWR